MRWRRLLAVGRESEFCLQLARSASLNGYPGMGSCSRDLTLHTADKTAPWLPAEDVDGFSLLGPDIYF